MKIFLLLLAPLLLTACADPAGHLNKMTVGMTKDEVTELLGEPQTTTRMNGREYMRYGAPDPAILAGCGMAAIYTFGLAAEMGDCKYANELLYVRLTNDKVDAYGPRNDFSSAANPEILGDIPALVIDDTDIFGPDSAGGVDVSIDFRIGTKETIKYARFWALPYNRVGDIVRSTVDGESEKQLETAGPYAGYANYETAAWKGVWYNPTLSCFEITKVEIEFMDESIERYEGERLNLAFKDSDRNDCSYSD